MFNYLVKKNMLRAFYILQNVLFKKKARMDLWHWNVEVVIAPSGTDDRS